MESTETLAEPSAASGPPELRAADPPPSPTPRRAEPGSSTLDSPIGGRHRSGVRGSSEASRFPPEETRRPSEALDRSSGKDPFRVGDFVWGKMRNHPWWPGKVVDPSEAEGAEHKDGYALVLFFGGGSSAGWCEPLKLRPFKEAFRRMVKQRGSSSYVGAVKEALDETRRCLDSQITCYCALGKDPCKMGTGRMDFTEKSRLAAGIGVGRLPVTNYSPREFLDHLRDSARDVLDVDMLEVTMLQSWVTALCCSEGRSASIDLVEPRDSNVVVLNETTDSRVLNRPEMSKDLNPRKERSIAELIAVPNAKTAEHLDEIPKRCFDLNKLDAPQPSSPNRGRKRKDDIAMNSDAEKAGSSFVAEHTRSGGGKLGNVESGGLSPVEETTSVRRERKKSKYLSPPYTDVSGYGKRSLSMKDAADTKDFKANLDVKHAVSEEEGDKTSRPLAYTTISAEKILFELLLTAANCGNQKWKRTVETLGEFLNRFRSYAYTDGSHFDGYRKFLDSITSGDGTFAKNDRDDGSGIGIPSGRMAKRKDRTNGETFLEQSNETNGTSAQRRKYTRKDKGIDEAFNLTPDHSFLKGMEVKSGYESSTGGQTPIVASMNKTSNKKVLPNGGTPVLRSHKPTNQAESSNSGRRKSRKELNGGVIKDSHQTPNKGREYVRSGQKREKKDEANKADLCILHLMFAPGSSLPSKDELASISSKFGTVVTLETQLEADSPSARVEFSRAIDAKRALKSLGNSSTFGISPLTKCELQSKLGHNRTSPRLVGSKNPLPFIKKNLERMISKLTGSTTPERDARPSKQLQLGVTANLVDDMEGMLEKVNKLLASPAAGTTI